MNKPEINRNPWPGLSSYKEPQTEEIPLAFCGRNREIEDLVPLIEGHIFTTIYGSSGLGKTSLLNAGVFPRLRAGQYLPINLRLSLTPSDSAFQQSIITAITEKVKETGGRIVKQDIVLEQFDLQIPEVESSEYLWTYFAMNQFLDSSGHPVTIILAFDQFEEVLYSRPKDATCLLKQILFLMNNDNHLPSFEANGVAYNYTENYRFIAILREDDLFMLEDIIDNNYLQSMKNNRYRLRELSQEAAREVIQIPGKDCLNLDEIDDITNQIIQYSQDNDGTISSSMISFLCNRLYIKGNGFITSELVKENEGKTLKEFCQELLAKLPYEEFIAFTDLLVEDGRRKLISLETYKKKVPHGQYLFDEETKLLDIVNLRKKKQHVEIIHDKFAAIVPHIKNELITIKEKDEAVREAEKANEAKDEANKTSIQVKRKNKWLKWGLALASMLITFALACIYYYANRPPIVVPTDDIPIEIDLIFSPDKSLTGYEWKAKVIFTDIDTLGLKLNDEREINDTDSIDIKARGDMNLNPDTIKLTMPKNKLGSSFKAHIIPINLCDRLTKTIEVKLETASKPYTEVITLTRSDSAMYKFTGKVTSATNGKPLMDALVILDDAVRHTDKDGSFTFYLNDSSELRDKTIYAIKNEYEYKEILASSFIQQLGTKNMVRIKLSLKDKYKNLYDNFYNLTTDRIKQSHYEKQQLDSTIRFTAEDSTILKNYFGSNFDPIKPGKCSLRDTTIFFLRHNKAIIGYYQVKDKEKHPFKGTLVSIQPEEGNKKNPQKQWQLTISAFDDVFNREHITGILSGEIVKRN